MRNVNPAAHGRGTATFSLGVVEGVGRRIDKAPRSRNLSSHGYDRDVSSVNALLRVAFAGDVTFFRKSTGWYTIRTSDGTYTFRPDARAFWAATGGFHERMPVATLLSDVAEHGTD
jgi:hypothetical protein